MIQAAFEPPASLEAVSAMRIGCPGAMLRSSAMPRANRSCGEIQLATRSWTCCQARVVKRVCGLLQATAPRPRFPRQERNSPARGRRPVQQSAAPGGSLAGDGQVARCDGGNGDAGAEGPRNRRRDGKGGGPCDDRSRARGPEAGAGDGGGGTRRTLHGIQRDLRSGRGRRAWAGWMPASAKAAPTPSARTTVFNARNKAISPPIEAWRGPQTGSAGRTGSDRRCKTRSLIKKATILFQNPYRAGEGT